MDKAEVKEAMAEAGLIAPKVLPVLLRSKALVFDLWAGPPGQRRSERIAAPGGEASEEAVEAAIDRLQPRE